jgi:hypothetical protein
MPVMIAVFAMEVAKEKWEGMNYRLVSTERF